MHRKVLQHSKRYRYSAFSCSGTDEITGPFHLKPPALSRTIRGTEHPPCSLCRNYDKLSLSLRIIVLLKLNYNTEFAAEIF